jgi:hypothetical protein
MIILPNITKGILFMLGFVFFLALSGVIIKNLSPAIPLEESCFFRSLIGIFIIVPLIKNKKISVTGSDIIQLVIRGVIGGYPFSAIIWSWLMLLCLKLQYYSGVQPCIHFFSREYFSKKSYR